MKMEKIQKLYDEDKRKKSLESIRHKLFMKERAKLVGFKMGMYVLLAIIGMILTFGVGLFNSASFIIGVILILCALCLQFSEGNRIDKIAEKNLKERLKNA